MRLADCRKIYVVCTGNTCRSPMAEHLLRRRLAEHGIDAVVASRRSTKEYSSVVQPGTSKMRAGFTIETRQRPTKRRITFADSGVKNDLEHDLLEYTHATEPASAVFISDVQGDIRVGSTVKIAGGKTYKHGAMSAETLRLLEKHLGPDPAYEQHKVQGLTDEDIASADLVIGMDRKHVEDVTKLPGAFTADGRLKAITFGDLGGEPKTIIPDPMIGGGMYAGVRSDEYAMWVADDADPKADRYLEVFQALDRLIAQGLGREFTLLDRHDMFIAALLDVSAQSEKRQYANAAPPGWPTMPKYDFGDALCDDANLQAEFHERILEIPRPLSTTGYGYNRTNRDLEDYAMAAIALALVSPKAAPAAERYLRSLPHVYEAITALNPQYTYSGSKSTVFVQDDWQAEQEARQALAREIVTRGLGKPVLQLARAIPSAFDLGRFASGVAHTGGVMTEGLALTLLDEPLAGKVRAALRG